MECCDEMNRIRNNDIGILVDCNMTDVSSVVERLGNEDLLKRFLRRANRIGRNGRPQQQFQRSCTQCSDSVRQRVGANCSEECCNVEHINALPGRVVELGRGLGELGEKVIFVWVPDTVD